MGISAKAGSNISITDTENKVVRCGEGARLPRTPVFEKADRRLPPISTTRPERRTNRIGPGGSEARIPSITGSSYRTYVNPQSHADKTWVKSLPPVAFHETNPFLKTIDPVRRVLKLCQKSLLRGFPAPGLFIFQAAAETGDGRWFSPEALSPMTWHPAL